MEKEKDCKTISLAASPLKWTDIEEDARKHGFNTVSAYTQFLYERSHNNLKSSKIQILRISLLLDTILLIIVIVLLLMRF